MRVRASWATSVVAVLVLLALSGTTFTSVAAIEDSIDRVTAMRAQSTRLTTLRAAVAEQAFAEAGYLREPGAVTWARLKASTEAILPAVAEARTGANGAEMVMLSTLVQAHARYVDQVWRSRGVPGLRPDNGVAGPALNEMRTLVESAIQRRGAGISDAVDEQHLFIRRVAALIAGVFVLAAGGLGWVILNNRRQERRLRRDADRHRDASLTDSLTGIPNRTALIVAMNRHLALQDHDAAMLFLDLDGFKPVNDTYGHSAGDAVLVEVGRRLRACVAAPDLVARLGGDEFAILLVSGASPEEVALRVLARFDVPFAVEGSRTRVGVSIGISETRDVGHDPDTLLRAADRAVYRAKHGGGGQLVRYVPA